MNKERRVALLKRVEAQTEVPMLLLSVVFLVVVLLPELTPVTEATAIMLDGILWLIWVVFALELLIKTYLAPERVYYLRSHWPDVLSVAFPFLRPLRLLRAFAVIARVWQRTRSTLRQKTLTFVGLSSLITVVVSAVLVFARERQTEGTIQTFPDALWWALATITTVGYGDTYPTTTFGRGVAVFLMFIGITLFGLLTASISAFFVEADTQVGRDSQEILERLKRIEERLERLDERGEG